MLLSSRDNPLIKDYMKLCASRSFREAGGRFALEGARLCKDAVLSGVALEHVFLTQGACEKYPETAGVLQGTGVRIYEITPEIAARMADTGSPQGVFATACMLDKTRELDTIDLCGGYIALENLQDPGNMGTVLRTAEALGLSGVLLSAGCVDVYSPKVLRAAMGAVFRIPLFTVPELPAALAELAARGMRTLAAVADSKAASILDTDLVPGTVMVVGNEGRGLTEACVRACGLPVTIPMGGRAQSLNAATAASILMWELAKRVDFGQKKG